VLIDRSAEPLDEAWELLNIAARSRGILVRNTAWLVEIARARLRVQQGEDAPAAEHARKALDILDHNGPQFSRHPDVGSIIPDRRTIRELKRLARSRAARAPR